MYSRIISPSGYLRKVPDPMNFGRFDTPRYYDLIAFSLVRCGH
jgi:hypothetical protein